MIKKFPYRSDPGREEARFFAEHGYLYVTQFYDVEREVEPIRKDIFNLINLITDSHGVPLQRPHYSETEFDHGLQYLTQHHRPLVGILYDAVKKLPNYLRLACNAKHDDYCRVLLETSFLGFANRGYGIRMDHPCEDAYSTQLHQDYVSQLSGQNAVVTWSPLRDVTPELGPLIVYPGSHRAGVFPVLKIGEGSRGLVIADEDKVAASYRGFAPEVQVGDCLMLHFLTLHASGKNQSDKTRWSMLSRYFDFNDATGAAINWTGGLQEGNSFEKIHPELMVSRARS
jgi:Phytanoyl-CoA dioxygenase (PhyH)